MDTIWLFILIALLFLLWQKNMQYREFAILQAGKICSEMKLQLLDDTVSLSGITWKNIFNRNREFLRKYTFEVCPDGSHRYNGLMILSGFKLHHIEIDLPEGTVILQNKISHIYH